MNFQACTYGSLWNLSREKTVNSDGVAWIAAKICGQNIGRGQGSRYTKSHSPLLHGEQLRHPGTLAGNKRMKNERRAEFWWDEGTGSVVTKIVATCAPPLDYKRSVWGVWLHVPAEAIRGSTCRTASFTLIWSGFCTDEQTKICESSWALGGALQGSCESLHSRVLKFLPPPNFAEVVNTGYMSPPECNRACLNPPVGPVQAGVESNSQG